MNLINKFTGCWHGTYHLVLSWLPNPDFISVSNMTIKSIANNKFLVFSYDWQHEGISQDGLILIGNIDKNDGITASWIDSWGMSGKIMNCHGTINEEGDIALKGSYEVQGHPDWGWRIEIPCPTDHTLKIIMYNVTPEGEQSLAGDSDYTRIEDQN